MPRTMRWFAIKAEVRDLGAETFVFEAQKTMYGGKGVAVGDPVFILASENEGGSGLFARGVVTECENLPRTASTRQTPRVSIKVKRDGTARRPLGRAQLRTFRGQASDAP